MIRHSLAHRLRRLDRGLLLWLVPPGVAMGLFVLGPLLGDKLLVVGIGTAIGLGIVVVAARRPAVTLAVLLFGLPVSTSVLSFLYEMGVPASAFPALRSWKELLGIAVLVAGIRARPRREGPDVLARLIVLYVVLVLAYVLVPQLALNDSGVELGDRLVAWRSNTTFLLVFLGAYWCRFSADDLRKAAKAVLLVGIVASCVGIYEFVDASGWNRFAFDTLGYPRFQVEINGSPLRGTEGTIIDRTSVAGRSVVRTGSIYFEPLAAGFALVLPSAIALERLTRRRAGPWSVAAFGVSVSALLLTQTRSAILAAAIAFALALRPAAGRLRQTRVRLALLLAVGGLFLAPLAVSSGLTDRVGAAIDGTDESSQGHIDAFFEGMDELAGQPLGFGLGTSVGVGQRLGTVEVVAENYYLQVGHETGVFALALFVAITVVAVRRLRRAAATTETWEIAAVAGAFLGLAVGSFFLHTWTNIPVAWTAWGLAGAALGAGHVARPGGSGPSHAAWDTGDVAMGVR